MTARPRVPEYIAEAIERAWPDGLERRFEGEGRVGHSVAVSLAAPVALVALNQHETFESGSRSEPDIELQVFDLEGKRLDAERHFLLRWS
jgi:hypothetical protein